MTEDLSTLETQAYRRAFSDGIIDTFVGASLIWIGIAWIWIPDFAGLAGVLPAVIITVVLSRRKEFMQSRIGYVRWSRPRRSWERRNLVLAFFAGVAMFAAGVAAYFGYETSATRDLLDVIAPGLMAFLLALLVGGLGLVMDAPRMLAYASVLAVGGVAAAVLETNPGWPLVIAGVAVATTGVVMLVRFLANHPVAEDA